MLRSNASSITQDNKQNLIIRKNNARELYGEKIGISVNHNPSETYFHETTLYIAPSFSKVFFCFLISYTLYISNASSIQISFPCFQIVNVITPSWLHKEEKYSEFVRRWLFEREKNGKYLFWRQVCPAQ